jgi:thiamine pyrophosphokinase
LGNFLLLLVAARKSASRDKPRIRLLNARYEVQLLFDGNTTIANAVGDIVSVLPVSERIRLSTTGTSYNVQRVEVLRGRSLGMRNRLLAKRATFRIEGMALLVRQFSKKKPSPAK